MAIYKAVVSSEYVQIPNATMQDNSISFEARGLLGMLLSMPVHWEVHKSWVSSQSKAGKDKVNSIFKELEDSGYIRKEETQRKFGKFASNDYFIFPTKCTSADLPLRLDRSGSTVNGESATRKETVKENKHIENKHLAAKAEKRLTKAELLVQKVRSEPNHYPLLNKLDDELLLEWAKLRTRKGASDSGRALNRIEKVLSTLSYTHAFEPDYAIGKQCDAGWTSIEVDYFVKGNSNTGQQVAVHQPQQSLDDALQRTF